MGFQISQIDSECPIYQEFKADQRKIQKYIHPISKLHKRTMKYFSFNLEIYYFLQIRRIFYQI